jgi:hypothetical protein
VAAIDALGPTRHCDRFRMDSRQHRENCLNVVRCRGQQSIVTGLATCGGLQNELSHMRLDCRRCLVQWNLGHHLIEGRPHGLDEFWTVARHDTVSRLCAGRVAGLPLTGQTQSREWNHANVTFDVFSIHKIVARDASRPSVRNLFVNTPGPARADLEAHARFLGCLA